LGIFTKLIHVCVEDFQCQREIPDGISERIPAVLIQDLKRIRKPTLQQLDRIDAR